MVYIYNNADHFYNVCKKLISKDVNFKFEKLTEGNINDIKVLTKRAYNISLQDINCTITNKYNLRRFLDVITYEFLKIKSRKGLFETIENLYHDLEIYEEIFNKKDDFNMINIQEYKTKFYCTNCSKDVTHYEIMKDEDKRKIKEEYTSTDEYINITKDIKERVAGVYVFYDINKNPIYVGKSTSDLCARIDSSREDRRRQEYIEYMSYSETKTRTDANIYEMYYIAKLKPFFNYDGHNSDETTLILPGLQFSSLVRVYQRTAKDLSNKIISRIVE